MASSWTRNHILSLADFTPAEYNTVLETAVSFREVLSRGTKKVSALQGQVVANLFLEPSTRTRSSFELAAKRLSADLLNFSPGSSSITLRNALHFLNPRIYTGQAISKRSAKSARNFFLVAILESVKLTEMRSLHATSSSIP